MKTYMMKLLYDEGVWFKCYLLEEFLQNTKALIMPCGVITESPLRTCKQPDYNAAEMI